MDKNFDFNKIGKRMPYTVPEDFFSTMEENVMSQVLEKPESQNGAHADPAKVQKDHKRTIRIALRSLIAAAAAVALFLVVQTKFSGKQEDADFASVELAFNNLSTDDQDFLPSVYAEEEYMDELAISDMTYSEDDL